MATRRRLVKYAPLTRDHPLFVKYGLTREFDQPHDADRLVRYENREFDPDQPRDDDGKWSAEGGGDSGGSTYVGSGKGAGAKAPSAKPAKVTEAEFVSPNVGALDFQGARNELNSERQSALREASAYIDGALGVDGKSVDIIGAWADGAENSVMDVIADSDWDKLVLGGSMKGYLADQKQVLIFQQQDGGSAVLAKFEAKGDIEAIHKNLLGAGLEFHTLVPTKDGATVYIADTDGTKKDAIKAGAASYDANVEIQFGRAEFIGTTKEDGSDREQRDSARNIYQGNISKSPVLGSAEIWQRVRDRWSQELGVEHPKAVAGYDPGLKAASGKKVIDAVKAAWVAASPIKTLNDIVAAAPEAQAQLGAVGERIGKVLGVQFKDPGAKTKDQHGIDRTKVKIAERNGVAARVTDVARASFIIDNPAQAQSIADELAKHFEVTFEAWKITDMNYADRSLVVRLPNGLLGEVQMMSPEMAKAKSSKAKGGGGGHDLYVERRALDPTASPEQKVESDRLKDEMRALYGAVLNNYGAAWKAALGISGSSPNSLA